MKLIYFQFIMRSAVIVRLSFATYTLICTFVQALPPLRNHKMLPVFPEGKIVGGSDIEISEVPYQLQLEDSGFQFCGASIVSEQYVLTAAHCTDGRSPSSLQVRSGSSCHASGGLVTQVAQIFQHPLYNQRTTDFDISILRLSSSISLDEKASPIQLAAYEPNDGDTGIISGWGVENEATASQPMQLQSTAIPIVDRASCNTAYENLITPRMICAGNPGHDTCQGDSGGPFVVDGVQVGIVSWGYGCARPGYPGVYSNIAVLRPFIDNHTAGTAKWR